jgi:hypothetical protein
VFTVIGRPRACPTAERSGSAGTALVGHSTGGGEPARCIGCNGTKWKMAVTRLKKMAFCAIHLRLLSAHG